MIRLFQTILGWVTVRSGRILGVGWAMLLSPSIALALTLTASKEGVIADGQTNNAAAIQAMIDKAAAAGGGRVILDGGTVVSGMITLKSNITLEVAEGATLMNTGVKEDYPYVPVDVLIYYPERRTMVYAQNAENVAILGEGTIDGKSSAYKARSSESARVSLIRLDGCKGVEVRDLTLQNASMWTQHFFLCDGVEVTGLTIKNYMKNDDGLNIDGSRNVLVDNCDITSHDDAITLKNTSHAPSENITVTNSRLNSVKSAFKFGTESYSGFINVTARNLEIIGGRDAIALYSSDGAKIENVLIEDVTITDSSCPISVILGNRLRKISGDTRELAIGSAKNITIRNVNATGSKWALMLVGSEDRSIEGVSLENIDVTFAAEPGGKKNSPRASRKVGENTQDYPQSRMFRTLNAWGLFARHANDITLKDVRFTGVSKSKAHMAYFENVDGLILENVEISAPETTPSWIQANGLSNAQLDINWPASMTWLEFVGQASEGIVAYGDASQAQIINTPETLEIESK
ncbi:MAG: glycoside hydrolase family 28 protein [Opitutales bacterium]